MLRIYISWSNLCMGSQPLSLTASICSTVSHFMRSFRRFGLLRVCAILMVVLKLEEYGRGNAAKCSRLEALSDQIGTMLYYTYVMTTTIYLSFKTKKLTADSCGTTVVAYVTAAPQQLPHTCDSFLARWNIYSSYLEGNLFTSFGQPMVGWCPWTAFAPAQETSPGGWGCNAKGNGY